MKKLFLLLAMLLLSATCYGWSDNDYSDEDKAIVADALTKAIYDIDGNGVVDSVDTGGSMTYPGAGIAVSTGSAWGTSITDNSSNWNAVYNWYSTFDPFEAADVPAAETDPAFAAWLLATPPLYPGGWYDTLQGSVNISGFNNDSGFTTSDDFEGWDTNASDDFTWDYDYTDLINKPTIPSYTFGTGLSEVGGNVICTVVDTNTTYSASDFDIKDLTDSTNLRAAWSAKLDAEVDGSTSNEINTITGDDTNTTSGLAITIAGAGTVSTSVSGDTLTITGTGDGTGTDDQTASEVSVTTTSFGGIFTNDADSNTVQKCLDKADDHNHSGIYEPAGITASDISDKNAGTDITADLEEESHASEHGVGGADTVFPADPDADRYLMWDDDPGALVWQTVAGGVTGVNETYGSGWDADTDAPEKDDVYDYLHLMDTDDDGAANVLDDFPAIGNDPDVSTAGHIGRDNDDHSLRGYDGANQFVYGQKIQRLCGANVIGPNNLTDAIRDRCIIGTNQSPFPFVVTKIVAYSDTDDTDVNVEEYDADGASNNATVDAIQCAAGSGPYTDDETAITGATIEPGHIIALDFDDTDDPGYVVVDIWGYYNADVNYGASNNATVDAIQCAAGSGPYTDDETAITGATIEPGRIIAVDIDNTDDKGMET